MVRKLFSGRMGLAVAAALSLAGLTSSSNAATITYDLRALSTDGGVLNDVKSVNVDSAGDTVTLGLYALVANADGNRANDGYLLTHTSVISAESASGPMGNLSSATFNSALIDSSTSTNGVPTNLDANPDLEVGSNTPGSATGYITASAGTGTKFGSGTGTGPTEFFIGTVTYTYNSVVDVPSSTLLNYNLRVKTDGTTVSRQTVKYTTDGVAKLIAGDNSNNPSGDIAIANPVSINVVPEPTALGLLGVGALAALRRRRSI